MALVGVRRDLGAGCLEHLAVADGAAADVDSSRLDGEVGRGDHPAWNEDLAAPRIDDGHCSRRAGRQRVERRDTGRRDAERQREPARGREADADAREAARPDAHREPLDVPGMHPGLPEQRVDVLEQGHGPRRPLAEDFTVVDERARRDVSRRVESQDHHRPQS